jgi:hypothetical protein
MKYSAIYISLLLIVSCKQYNKTENNNFSLNKFLTVAGPYLPTINPPEDTLLLGFSKGSLNEDTSWTLLIYKSKEVIHCRFYFILPYNVSGFDNSLNDSSKLLYYEAFSFEIEKRQWKNIESGSGLESYFPKDSVAYEGCLHCPRYFAFYKSALIVNSKLDNPYLRKLDRFLNEPLVNGLFEMKRHRTIRLQPSGEN